MDVVMAESLGGALPVVEGVGSIGWNSEAKPLVKVC